MPILGIESEEILSGVAIADVNGYDLDDRFEWDAGTGTLVFNGLNGSAFRGSIYGDLQREGVNRTHEFMRSALLRGATRPLAPQLFGANKLESPYMRGYLEKMRQRGGEVSAALEARRKEELALAEKLNARLANFWAQGDFSFREQRERHGAEAYDATIAGAMVGASVPLGSWELGLVLGGGEEEMELTLPEISDEAVLTLLPDKEQVYATALTLMPEVKAGKLSTQAAELNEKIAKSGYFPTVSLQASTGTGHNSASDLGFGKQLKRSWNNMVGLSLSIPLLDNRSNKSAVEKARLQTLNSRLQESETAKTLYETIEQAWQNAYSSQNEYLAAREKERYARESYELVSQQFALGMKNTVELITEKTTLQNARQEKLQAKYMSLLNQKLLRFYQGEMPVL